MLTLDKRRANAVGSPDGAVPPKRVMTEAEFVEWTSSDHEVRAEWVDGEVVVLSPNSTDHDALLIWLMNVLAPFVEHHDLGTVLGPNVTARFASQKRRRVPDLLFVAKARGHLIKKSHVEGAPDLIIEIVSPESQSRDWRGKYLEYQKAGVREYWIIDPLGRQMEAHALKRGKYVQLQADGGVLRSVLLPGFFLSTTRLWRKPLPKYFAAQRELGLR